MGTFRCKSWRCPHCGPRRRGRWVARVAQLLEGWDRVRFWTLTLAPDLIPQGVEPERWLLDSWKRLRVHLAQRCPRCNRRARGGPPRCKRHPDVVIQSPSFVWVLEYTKKGVPHLHVAVNQFVPRSWLKTKWEKLTGAWNVDLRDFRDVQDATSYLAKYLGKTLTILEADGRGIQRLRGVHVYGSSQDMPITPPKTATDWELVRVPEHVGALLAPFLGLDPEELERLSKEELEISAPESTNGQVGVVLTDQTLPSSKSRPPPLPPTVGRDGRARSAVAARGANGGGPPPPPPGGGPPG